MSHGEAWRAKISQCRPIMISHVKTRTSLTTVAGRFAMIPVSRGSGNVIPRTALFLVFAVAAGAAIVKADKGARMSAAGRACSGSLGQGGHHAIDQFRSHRHPEACIEPAPGQAHHLASAAGHHAETQHYRPAGARTGLAASRRPSLVVQEICRIAGRR